MEEFRERLARMEERQVHHFMKLDEFLDEQKKINQSHWNTKERVDKFEAKIDGAWWAFGVVGVVVVALAGVIGWAVPTYISVPGAAHESNFEKK